MPLVDPLNALLWAGNRKHIKLCFMHMELSITACLLFDISPNRHLFQDLFPPLWLKGVWNDLLHVPSFCIAIALDAPTVLDVLHEAKFADHDWEDLGLQLMKPYPLKTIKANHPGEPSVCMIDTVFWWIKSDEKANWEKLAEALSKLESYGEKAENDVREKAGIGAKQKTCGEYN